MQGLGGKFGEKICEDLGIKHMGDLNQFSKEELQRRYDERNGQWLYNIARGIDLEAVTPRLVSKSIGCCKKFPGRNAISALTTLNHWLHELAQEIAERLQQDEMENNRKPKQMVVSFVQTINNADVSSSRTVNLTTIDEEKIATDALDVLKRNTEKFFKTPDNCTVLNNPIKFLGLNVGKFENNDTKKGNTIQNMFQKTIENQKNESKVKTSTDDDNSNGSDGKSEENKAKDDKKKEPKESYFAKYRRLQLEKQAQEEAARLAEEEAAQKADEESLQNSNDEAEMSDEENTFNDDMLMEELKLNNQTILQQEETQRPITPGPAQESTPMPSSSTKPDYKQSYAEFYSASKIELPKVECTQCGKTVNAHELQIHTDEHLAFQLTQEQRTEFQNQIKRNVPTTIPAAKKQKTTTNNKNETTVNKVASIQKFLVKPGQDDSAPTPSTSTQIDIDTEKCTECGKNIPVTEILEHMDFHAAKKLHEELIRAEMVIRTNNNTVQNISGKNASTGKSKKSTKKTASTSKSNNPNAMKNIASFFQNS